MPSRILPTRDVTLADGCRLYYQQEESRRHAEAGVAASVYMSKRGPDGALHILITVDDEPARGEHYHLSGSYPARTPTPDEMVAALRALIPGGGQFGVMTPERNPKALHGHVVHLVEETPRSIARHAAAAADKPTEVYARSVGSPTRTDATDDAAKLTERLEHLRIDLGLVPPFTTAELREALDQVRARRGVRPGTPPPYSCTEQRGKDIIIPYPSNLSPSEQEHAQWHGIAHLIREHQQLTTGIYTSEQEREAEAWADEMMTYVLCGDPDNAVDAADE